MLLQWGSCAFWLRHFSNPGGALQLSQKSSRRLPTEIVLPVWDKQQVAFAACLVEVREL